MAASYNSAVLSRPEWGGANADVDLHIEAYEGDIDGSFRVESLFRSSGLTNFKSVSNNSNTWRGDRIGGAVVAGRKSGQTLDGARIANDKFVITVDTVSYIRTPIDYQDDWTAADMQAEYSAEHGSAHAKAFDQAHIIQLIKCSAFVPPTHLASSFSNGIAVTFTGYNAAVATTTLSAAEAKADILVQAHKGVIATFVKRDLGGSVNEMVTLCEVDFFNALVEHKKLLNVDYMAIGSAAGAANDFSMRRVGWLNGIRVIETPRFPTAAIPSHFLGTAFNVSAAEAKARMIVFHPKKALVTVEAKEMTVRAWDDPLNFQTVLDSYTMYTVGAKRPDAVAVLFAE